MPDIEVSSSPDAGGLSPVNVDNSSTVELPPSGSLDAGGSQPTGKLTEQQIIDSFTNPTHLLRKLNQLRLSLEFKLRLKLNRLMNRRQNS